MEKVERKQIIQEIEEKDHELALVEDAEPLDTPHLSVTYDKPRRTVEDDLDIVLDVDGWQHALKDDEDLEFLRKALAEESAAQIGDAKLWALKQKQIKEKSAKDAESSQARTIGPLATTATVPAGNIGASATSNKLATNSAKPPHAIPDIAKQGLASAKSSMGIPKAGKPDPNGKPGRISMFIQPIPPFKGKRASAVPSAASATPSSAASNAPAPSPAPRTNSNQNAAPLSPAAQNRLNVNASSFRPNGKPFSPVSEYSLVSSTSD